MDSTPDAAIDALRSRVLHSLPPLAIVLGSGLGAFADEAPDPTAISYIDIPGFPVPSVEGHAGRLVVGTIEELIDIFGSDPIMGKAVKRPRDFQQPGILNRGINAIKIRNEILDTRRGVEVG